MQTFLSSARTFNITSGISFLAMKAAINGLEQSLATKDKEISTMQSKITELQSDLDALGKSLDEKEKQLTTLREENRKLKTQVGDANIKVHILVIFLFVHFMSSSLSCKYWYAE